MTKQIKQDLSRHQESDPTVAHRTNHRTDASRAMRLKVKDGLVFVIKKLHALLDAQRLARKSDASYTGEPVAALMDHCWLPVLEAVREWGVMPEGIRIAPHPEGLGCILVDTELQCTLPGIYRDIEAAQEAVAQLIEGKPIDGGGTLVYRNQSMTPLVDISFDRLPAWPDLLSEVPQVGLARASLGQPPYREGFTLLDRPLFERICSQEHKWICHVTGARRLALEKTEEVASFIAQLSPEPLLELPFQNSLESQSLSGAHELYPELAHLDSDLLDRCIAHFEAVNPKDENSGIERRRDFPIFLAGVMAGCESDPSIAQMIGSLCVFAWLRGERLQKAIQFALQVQHYGSCLHQLSSRTRAILTRIERDDLTLGAQGDWIEFQNRLRTAFGSGSRRTH
jgi:hypothetical protein